MPHDPEAILRQVGQADEHFRGLMGYLRGPEAQGSSAYEVELTLFRSLLALGAKLLTLFFMLRAAARVEEAPVAPDGSELRLHSWRQATYFSVFGPLRFRRRYYRTPDGSGTCPLDGELSLPRRCYSDLLRSWLEFGLTGEAYDQTVELLERILGSGVSKRALERLAAEDAGDVEVFYAQKTPPERSDEGSILVVQADGKGVPMRVEDESAARRTEKKEAVITVIYSIEEHPADAEAIADKLAGMRVALDYELPKTPRPQPVAKRLRATLDGKDVAFERLVHVVRQRDGPHIRHRVALTDGDPALQDRMRQRLPEFTLVLDIVHVVGYVAEASVALLGDSFPYLRDFVACRLHEILTGDLDGAIGTFELLVPLNQPSKANQAIVATTLGYLRRNAPYMHYDQYLAYGWPIATGMAEGACGHLVKDRMERAGMHWRKPGAQAVLDLRSVRVHDDWDDYQRFRRQREHHRSYPSTHAPDSTVEQVALALAA